MSTTPIAEYALLSDRHSAALVSRAGSIDWLCFPRFDSPSIFGRILGRQAGHWSIQPDQAKRATRRYIDGSLVLETTWRAPTGTVVVVDALATGEGNRGHSLGKDAPHLVLRRATCTSGEVRLIFTYAPRPEYGLVQPLLQVIDGGVTALGGADAMILSCPIALTLEGSTASGELRLRSGKSVGFALHHAKRIDGPPRVWSQAEIADRLQDTVSAWQSWSEIHQGYVGPWCGLVRHSGRVLQALSFAPTGAICAAATTSLPEVVGGERNWDYRYSWVRDASFTIEALWVAACPDEANRFFDFVTTSAASTLDRGSDLQIMFGIGGERDLSERELSHLEGWRHSSPVRVGNGAWRQRQLDVYGELLGAADRLSHQLFDSDADRAGPPIQPSKWSAPYDRTPATRRFLVQAAHTAARHWQEKDHGIWEFRGEPRHFLYSKLMCWVALDRAVSLADRLDATDHLEAWERSRTQIREAILTQGWNDRAGAFTQSFGSDDLDASSLMIPLVEFLPADDPRVLATIDATEDRLTDARGLVCRYRNHDGLEGEEGSFLLCTFWLAQAMARAQQLDRARIIFERAAAFANDVGLLSEEVDGGSGELLGNFPQAFSHIGLVNAAWAIAEMESRETSIPPERTRAQVRGQRTPGRRRDGAR